ncbi:succinyl-diaminopimelate desuccinylase [Rubricella aquisinus]|uniref:Succinyl-diaminopimelate desuccinylase n=1 Tax=Rubricella aquisinus TaxID=2028108 RepID=A0A840WK33_9RHOB|nr:succinyl-diaminopimelate desuccinylase [Rubricella aquisinus]MBB5515419.1 succinyl-diaminopimelate desuccinylase [Rubricella aquisinus]
MPTDPVALTQELIRCPSVTPEEGGAITLLAARLEDAGFTCTRVDRNGIANLFARWGNNGNGPAFGFNGHTDVVPIGNPADWTHDPFGAVIVGDTLYGRGACDMKSGVAAFVAAAIDFVAETPPDGSIVITITGDEEGDGVDGTDAILDWMEANGERMDACLVGEPTCPDVMGDMIKIGRRGSMTAYITATGQQGHAAYPHRARNPLPVLVKFLDRIASHQLDDGTAHFDASTLAIASIDVGNPANNVIPAQGTAMANIRFNDAHTSQMLITWLEQTAQQVSAGTDVEIAMTYKVSGESFITPPGALSDLISMAVEAETGRVPEMSTTGGTSDARFVKRHCPVVECGLVGQSMHQVDEHVSVSDIHTLKAIYTRVLRGYFAA